MLFKIFTCNFTLVWLAEPVLTTLPSNVMERFCFKDMLPSLEEPEAGPYKMSTLGAPLAFTMYSKRCLGVSMIFTSSICQK